MTAVHRPIAKKREIVVRMYSEVTPDECAKHTRTIAYTGIDDYASDRHSVRHSEHSKTCAQQET